MTELQIIQALANGGMTTLVLVAFVYYAREAQRREREAREDYTKRETEMRDDFERREAVLIAESQRREAQLIADGKRREELLIGEFQRRETSLMALVSGCAEQFKEMSRIMSRLETWLRKTD